MSEDAVPNQERNEDTKKAYNLLAQGKRNMICQEYNTAVNQYQEACELLAKWFGETGKELAEPYFRYGSALLELARAESGVFGPALPAMDDEDDDDEAESSEEQGEKTSDENDDGESATTKENSADESASQEGSPSAEEKDKEEEQTDGEKKEDEKMEGESKKDGEKEDDKMEGETKKEAGKTDDAQAGCSKDENGKEKEEEEDESNLKLAWEVLELAKVIFLRSETKEDQLKAGECFIKLGEIGLESDTIEGAIQDFKSSLEIQLKHVEPHNRVLAETHYQLGMAYGMAGDMENSAESYRQAAKSIRTKIEVLEKMTEGAAADKGKAPASVDDPIANAQDELRELKELLPDIVAKVEEADAEARNSLETARRIAARAFGMGDSGQGNPFAAFSAAASAGFASSSSTAAGSSSSSSSQPQASSTSEASSSSVSNISHLVRKKRKQEGEDGDCGVEVKRTRSENGTGEAACKGSQGQQEQGSGDSTTTTEKQTTPAPVAAVSGESA